MSRVSEIEQQIHDLYIQLNALTSQHDTFARMLRNARENKKLRASFTFQAGDESELVLKIDDIFAAKKEINDAIYCLKEELAGR